jgi:RNA methyltransferase, TrmH family
MLPASQHPHSRIVQSRQNRRVKELRASFASGGKAAAEAGAAIGIEGEHLLAEALRTGLHIETVFYRSGDEALLARMELDPATDILELPADVFLSAVTTESPQGIAALVVPREFSLADTLRPAAPLIVIAAGLQDPGNLGTLVRSAEAFGASGVITLPGTVSLWNPKTLRASSGSVFRLPVVAAREDELFPALRSAGLRIFAAVAGDAEAASRIDLTAPAAILIGNEGRGLSQALQQLADARVTIPCPGPVESLNAAIAASILLYEASRQRESAFPAAPRGIQKEK